MYKRIYFPLSKKIYGRVDIHGSKSITNRALLVSSLARGEGYSLLHNVLFADDTIYMVKALASLGVVFDIDYSAFKIRVYPASQYALFRNLRFYLGNCATAFRFLLSYLFLYRGYFLIFCDKAMQRRPIVDLVNALFALGCDVSCLNADFYPPVSIYSKGFVSGGYVELDSSVSSQYLSSLLLSAPYFFNGISVFTNGKISSKPYINITLGVMNDFGISVKKDSEYSFFVSPSFYLQRDYFIEGDFSNALYFFAMAIITGGAVCVNNLDYRTSQGDSRCLEVFEKMGARVIRNNDSILVSGLVKYSIDCDFNDMPDCVPIVAVLALFVRGVSVIRNIFHLRFKETDRIQALADQMRRLGARIVIDGDDLYVYPADFYSPCDIFTYDDHRMIMAFSVAALRIRGLGIRGIEKVSKSFPDYFKVFDSLCWGY